MNALTPNGPVAPQARLRFPADSVAGLAGTSFKHEHLQAIIDQGKHEGFFEVHAENYMGAGGPPHRALEQIRKDYPLSLHGVFMSIGGPEPLDLGHLERFRSLVARYEPALVSEHLAWSTHETTYFNDLLPLPYTEATLARVEDHIDRVQHAIGRPILLENPSTYLAFSESTILLGNILALRRRGPYGLLFLDGHTDFYQPEAEPNGEAASMDLALATGRGPAVVTDLEGRCPLVRDEDVVVFGRRDFADAEAHGSQRIEDTAIAMTDLAAMRVAGVEAAAANSVARLSKPELDGFWIHLDADVLDDAVMPAVDYRMPEGLSWEARGRPARGHQHRPRSRDRRHHL